MQAHFIFFSPTMPKLKNKKSLQANAQEQCKLDTTDLRPNRATSANTGLAKVAVQCSADTFSVNQSLVLRINISSVNRNLRQARNRYLQA